MSTRLELYGLVGLGVALMQCCLTGCTLTADPYDPIEATAPLQQAAAPHSPDAGAASAPPPPAAPPPASSPSCTSENEVAGCVIERVPGSCSVDSDCESGVCRTDRCQPPSCDDGRRNQDEADVDCGGRSCPRCAVGTSCAGAADCDTGVCGAGGCGAGIARCCQAPSCSDGVTNGDEPVTDCGDATCGACALGHACTADSQCVSALCQAGTCHARACADGVKSGTESDTDCGGTDAECRRCSPGERCAAGGDCVSGNCVAGRCSSCGDHERNGTETGVDCGGACGPCPPGDDCRVDADCQSAVCEDGRCCGGTRVDCTRCARRLARVLDCNGNGPNGAAQCNGFLDCLADHPAECPVRYAPGCSDNPGGACDSTAFGSNTGPGVELADAILGTAGCTFGDE